MDTITTREYAYCRACGEIVCRIPGYRHGDGQQDTDDAPVWLLASPEVVAESGVNPDDLPDVLCGCNA